MSDIAKNAKNAKNTDVSTFQKLCGAITSEPSIRSSWHLSAFSHLPTLFQAVSSNFKIRLHQI